MTVVGSGANETLFYCTDGIAGFLPEGVGTKAARHRSKNDRLQYLHSRLKLHLDSELISQVVPQGWTLDLTENSCREMRRWDRSRCHRIYTTKPDISHRKAQISAIWEMIGFRTAPPICNAD